MLLPLLLGYGHVLAMIVFALFVLGERLEAPVPPAWRWRGTGKAVRIIAAQTRLHLIAPSRVRQAAQAG